MLELTIDVKLQHDFLDRAKYNDWQTVRKMVEEFPGVVSANPAGRWSALHHAAGQGNLEMVEYLLTHNADANVKASNGDTPLAVAMTDAVKDRLGQTMQEHSFLDHAKYHDWNAVKRTLSEFSGMINAHPLGRWSALHHAAGQGHTEMVEYLLASKADPMVKAKNGDTPLHVATSVAVKDLLSTAAKPACMSGAASDAKPVMVPVESASSTDAPSDACVKSVAAPVDASPSKVSHKSDSDTPPHGVSPMNDDIVGPTPQKRRLSSDLGGPEKKQALHWNSVEAKNGESCSSGSRTCAVIDLIESSDDEKTKRSGPAINRGSDIEGIASTGKSAVKDDARSSSEDTIAKREAFLRLFAPKTQHKPESTALSATPPLPSAVKEAPVGCPVKPSLIVSSRGPFELISAYDIKVLEGSYVFDGNSRELVDESGNSVARFTDLQMSPKPFVDALLQNPGPPKSLPCVTVVSSEIMEEIQDPKNQGAWFVLPSQLNGVEYPAHLDKFIVAGISDYKRDNTGGPRGQLAVHPAAGQFLLDNAACSHRPDGISSVDAFLTVAREYMCSEAAKKYDVHVKNGYLALPDCPPEIQEEVLKGFRQGLHTMRCLTMQSVPACGLEPSLKHRSHHTHKVNLVYASAVPIDAYLNRGSVSKPFQKEVGRLFNVAQYCGALRVAISRMPAGNQTRTRVFLMPLGGGVFNNRLEDIVSAISTAIELVALEGVDVCKILDVRVLTFKGKPSEQTQMTALVKSLHKLRE